MDGFYRAKTGTDATTAAALPGMIYIQGLLINDEDPSIGALTRVVGLKVPR